MAGITDLEVLLASMEPALLPGEIVFATFPDGEMPSGLKPIGLFREEEGLTAMVALADLGNLEGVTRSAPMRQITLTVHSSLDAVGLTAAVASELAAHDISANVVAAFYHDHIFVGSNDGERALALLQNLARRHRKG